MQSQLISCNFLKLFYQRLYQLGARKMMFHGIGPLGCIPSQRAKSSRGQCLKQVNLWVQQFNSEVQKLLANLNRHLPSAQFSFADTYQAVLDLIDNPTAYGKAGLYIYMHKTSVIISEADFEFSKSGFKVSNTSCCNVDTKLGGLCVPNSKVCKNHSEYVFWDAFHPTDAANEVLAGKLFAELFSHPPSAAPLASP